MQRQGENISGAMMHEILREVDVNSNGLVELDEFLQVDWLNFNHFTNCLYFHTRVHFACFCSLFFLIFSVNDLTLFFELQLMACIKSGRVTNSRFDQLAQEAQKDAEEEEAKRKAIPVDRSGGGV